MTGLLSTRSSHWRRFAIAFAVVAVVAWVRWAPVQVQFSAARESTPYSHDRQKLHSATPATASRPRSSSARRPWRTARATSFRPTPTPTPTPLDELDDGLVYDVAPRPTLAFSSADLDIVDDGLEYGVWVSSGESTSSSEQPAEPTEAEKNGPETAKATSSESADATETAEAAAAESEAATEITTADAAGSTAATGSSSQDVECKHLPNIDDVFVAIKGGSSEIYSKLPSILLTLMQCVPHYAIFSDLEQVVVGQHVIDSLDEWPESVTNRESEFEYYRQMNQLYKEDGQDVAKLQGDEVGDDRKGWKLDKWKFLPLLRKSWRLKPNMKFYMLTELDSALFWNNLMQWVQHLDPDKPLYAGAQNWAGDITFAHGGSGVLMSRESVKRLVEAYDERIGGWADEVADNCCGDIQLAKAFTDVGVAMDFAWPLLQGETPASIDWLDMHMCTPSVMWHHVGSQDVNMLWDLQMNWTERKASLVGGAGASVADLGQGWQEPYLYRDIFDDLVTPQLKARRDDWDNISNDWQYSKPIDPLEREWLAVGSVQRESVSSFDACRAACLDNVECRQFRHKENTCVLGRHVRLGRKTKESEGWASGWLVDRVKEYRDHFNDCGEVRWPGSGKQ